MTNNEIIATALLGLAVAVIIALYYRIHVLTKEMPPAEIITRPILQKSDGGMFRLAPGQIIAPCPHCENLNLEDSQRVALAISCQRIEEAVKAVKDAAARLGNERDSRDAFYAEKIMQLLSAEGPMSERDITRKAMQRVGREVRKRVLNKMVNDHRLKVTEIVNGKRKSYRYEVA